MRYFMLWPLLVLAACGANDVTSGPASDEREYATQIDVPSPDYAALIAGAPEIVPSEIDGEPASLNAPPISEAALPAVRMWPAATMPTEFQMEAAFSGRIFLRDGCVFIQGFNEGAREKLAWFHAETGLDLDAEGFYVLINRVNGQIEARLGETMSWAGPNPIDQSDPAIAAYREACGDYDVEGVGNPQANEKRYVIYPHLRQPPDSAPPPGLE